MNEIMASRGMAARSRATAARTDLEAVRRRLVEDVIPAAYALERMVAPG